MGPRPRPDEDDSVVTIGCLVGFVMGLVGAVAGTIVLLLLRPTWIAREGDPIGAIVAGLLIGWAVAIGVAMLANVILVALMSALERTHGGAPTRLNVALIFIVPTTAAAATLWLAASVNR